MTSEISKTLEGKIPYFRLYPGDFMNGVRGLSAQEVGVLTMLLCRMYEENGPIEYHALRLATYCGMREKSFKKVIDKLIELDKLTVDQGFVINKRAMLEIEARNHDLKKKKFAGKRSAEKRWKINDAGQTPVEQTLNDKDPDTDKDESGGGSVVECLSFREEVISACGLDTSGIKPSGRMVGSAAEWKAFEELCIKLELTRQETLAVVEEVMLTKPDGPPNSLKYFHAALERAAKQRHSSNVVNLQNKIDRTVQKQSLRPNTQQIVSENPELDR